MSHRGSIDPLRAVLYEQGRSLVWLARNVGVSRQVIYLWAWGEKRVPAWRAREIERLLGVPASQLFPNVED